MINVKRERIFFALMKNDKVLSKSLDFTHFYGVLRALYLILVVTAVMNNILHINILFFSNISKNNYC